MPHLEKFQIAKSYLSIVGLSLGIYFDIKSYPTATQSRSCADFYPPQTTELYNCSQHYLQKSWNEWMFSKLWYSLGIMGPLVFSPDKISRREMFNRIYAATAASMAANAFGSAVKPERLPIIEDHLKQPALPSPSPTRISNPGYI